ncbi:MAG: NAD-binding protein [Desulforhopalus sp.]
MRIVFSGANPTAVKAAEKLIEQGHEIIIIEINKEKIDDLSDDLDCSFIHGDAGKPAILSEVAPEECDFLFCLTDNDHANIITSLLARSMGFNKIITCIQDEDLLPLCDELGLLDIIVPDRTISQYLTNTVSGLDSVELSTLLRGNARFFSFNAQKEDEGLVGELDLPDKSKVMYYYRDDDFFFTDADTPLQKGDEVVILTSSDHLTDLTKRWHPQEVKADEE